MHFQKYLAALGLATTELPSDKPNDKNMILQDNQIPILTKVPVLNTVQNKDQLNWKNQLPHNHHSHQQIHNNVQVPLHKRNVELHPTMQARINHLNVKEKAYERIGNENKEKENQKREEKLDYRPFIVTNHLKDETVWPGWSSKQQSGGFELGPRQSVTVKLPLGSLRMFRAWIRRGCSKGKGENDLTCITGDCNGKLRCEGWNKYGNSVAEIAIVPEDDSFFPDLSYVESGITLPLTFGVDNCLSITCDTSSVPCPESMQVKDQKGKILECACGAKNWNDLLDPILGCPNFPPLSEVQKQWKKLCPDIYSFASDDSTGQKHCPYHETSALRLDVGYKENPLPLSNVQQVVKPEEDIPKQEEKNVPETTKPILFQESWKETEEWKNWAKDYKWDGKEH